MSDNICVYGARVHNLKNIDVVIPRHSLTVITGLSGSGKSSLARTLARHQHWTEDHQQEPSLHRGHHHRDL